MRILLAEDIGVTRRMLAEVLEDMGHEVVSVADGEAAWTAFEANPFPLVVVDWMMPVVDGLELARRIRAAPGGEDIFLLLQTGRATSEDLLVALQAGMDDYIAKPVTPEHLRARIAIAMQRMEDRKTQRMAEAEVARSRWLAGIGETSLAIQHEIATPLTALLGEISFGLSASDAGQMREALLSAEAQALRVADALKQLATLRSPQTVEPLPGLRMLDLHGGEPRNQ